jgi:hypothetical protein
MRKQQSLTATEVITGVVVGALAISVIDALLNRPQDILNALSNFNVTPPNNYLAVQESQPTTGQDAQRSSFNFFQLPKAGEMPPGATKPILRRHNSTRRMARRGRSSTFSLLPAVKQAAAPPSPFVEKKAPELKLVPEPPKHEQVLTLFHKHLDETGKRGKPGLSFTKEFTAFIQPMRKALAEEQRKLNVQSSPKRLSAGRPAGSIDPLTARILDLQANGKTRDDICELTYEGHNLASKTGKAHKAKVNRLLKYHSQKSPSTSQAVTTPMATPLLPDYKKNN